MFDFHKLQVSCRPDVSIEEAFRVSESELREGNSRQAIQEVLWLLKTFSTAIRSEKILFGSIQGRHFNNIIGKLPQRQHGHQKQKLDWMKTLYGYLSSPTGGGVHHGIDLNDGLKQLRINEVRLYCNLIQSYLTFLISEREQLRQ